MGKRHVSLGFDIWWPDRPRVWQFVKRHLLPTPANALFTLLVVVGLIWASSVGALPLGATLTSSTSTSTIAYQGRLADADGNPLTDTYNMIFRLYEAASGGAPLWEEQWTGSNGVQVSDGLFNVMLGSLTPIPQSIITGNDSLFLGITVGTDDEMIPRVQLGSVPFAVQALTVPDGSITAEKLADGAMGSQKVSLSHFTAQLASDWATTVKESWVDVAPLTISLSAEDVPVDSYAVILASLRPTHSAEGGAGAVCITVDSGQYAKQGWHRHGNTAGSSPLAVVPLSAGSHTIGVGFYNWSSGTGVLKGGEGSRLEVMLFRQ